MSTILWEDITFGPIHSRRVGTSLGINLLPIKGKICSFDCVYCECGWNKDGKQNTKLPDLEDIKKAIETKFKEVNSKNIKVDSISFTGNGEPTIHPNFPEIIDYVIELRNKYLLGAEISVFSNAMHIDKPAIREALQKVENPILKLDAASNNLAYKINQPQGNYDVEKVVANMKLFNGNFIMQTMFLKGETEKGSVDNTIESNVEEWRKIVLELKPRKVMVYSFERETPSKGLIKATVEEMKQISAPLIEEGIVVQINA